MHSYFTKIAQSQLNPSPPPLPEVSTATVLIVIDALNARHVGVYGYERNTTPNIDAFAQEGVVFTQWISNSSWTRPSFTTIVTGVPKAVHGMELSDKALPKKIATLAEQFRAHHFKTAAFVGNPLIQKKWRYDQGFDHFEDTEDHGDFPRADVLVNRALRWIETETDDRPFLVVLFLTDPHAPYEPAQDARQFSKSFEEIVTSPQREVLEPFDTTRHAGIVAAYDDEVAFADAQVGRFLTELKRLEKYRQTTIAVTADHGEIFGAHNCYQHAYHMWEPVLRVPFIIRAPQAGGHEATLPQTGPRFDDRPFTHTDVLPTLLHAAGIESKTPYGQSVFAPNADLSRVIVSEYDARGVKRTAARIGNLKLVRYEKVNGVLFEGIGRGTEMLQQNPSLLIPGPRYELFDLSRDAAETNNEYANYDTDEQIEPLRRAVKPTPKKKSSSPGQAPVLDADTLNALTAAGYIQ